MVRFVDDFLPHGIWKQTIYTLIAQQQTWMSNLSLQDSNLDQEIFKSGNAQICYNYERFSHIVKSGFLIGFNTGLYYIKFLP